MDTLQENKPTRTPVGVKGIAAWLLVTAVPFVRDVIERGDAAVLSPAVTLEIAYISITVICALGLLFRQNWARKAVVLFFVVYFFWSVWLVNFSVGDYFDPWVRALSDQFFTPVNTVKKVALAMLLIYIFWPVVVVFYLTCPPIKLNFQAIPGPKVKKTK